MSRAREFADLAGSADAGGLTGRNLIINGAMQVAQRGSSTASVTSNGYYASDRMNWTNGTLGTWTISQSTTTPDGFSNSYKALCTVADASPAAGDYAALEYSIEGQDLQHLQKGSSSAKKVTLSFWTRSNKTGTYVVELKDQDNNRHIASTYTISSADTWEHKTLTFAGDTTGSFDNDNSKSLSLYWYLGAGTTFTSGTLATSWASVTNANRAAGLSVNLGDTVNNEWYITGVQLEVGEKATPFEHRSYGDELARCQRYYNRYTSTDTEGGLMNFAVWSAQTKYGGFTFTTEMRANPTFSVSALSDFNFYTASSTGVPTAIERVDGDTKYAEMRVTHTSLGNSGNSGWLRIIDATNGWAAFDAEL
jgi:hypothetical protein